MMKEMQRQIHTFAEASFPCLQMEVFNLTEEEGRKNFLKEKNTIVNIPFSKKQVIYANHKKVGIAVSSLGTNKAVALGAYTFALSQLEA